MRPPPVERYDEALYWMGILVDREELEDYNYYLHAFVYSAQSVREVLVRHYCNNKNPEMLAWYRRREAELAQSAYFEIFKQRRSYDFHTRPTRTRIEYYDLPFHDQATGQVVEGAYQVSRRYVDGLDEPIDTCCNHFLRGLYLMLAEFGERFGEWSPSEIAEPHF